jgi:1-acyl-sn-glycerol-3-phosphate acyltransferase
VLALAGWRAALVQPLPERCVVLVYPHTSNWDFPIGLAFTWMTGLGFRFVGKDSLFKGPFGRLLRYWGGIPVNRREPAGVMASLARAFADEREFRIGITPEGTRAHAKFWKSGFYRLARIAKVPVALAFIDYRQRVVGIGGYFDPTGDVAADMARIAAFYADKVGRHPERMGPVRMRDDFEH